MAYLKLKPLSILKPKKLIAFKNKGQIKFIKQLIGFLAAGLPAFLVAIPINYLFVDILSFGKPLAYFITLIIQVTINFFMLKRFVFKGKTEDSILKQYLQFLGGISVFRLMDWGLYTFLVSFTSIYYLYIQAANVFIFSIFKFLYSKYILEK